MQCKHLSKTFRKWQKSTMNRTHARSVIRTLINKHKAYQYQTINQSFKRWLLLNEQIKLMYSQITFKRNMLETIIYKYVYKNQLKIGWFRWRDLILKIKRNDILMKRAMNNWFRVCKYRYFGKWLNNIIRIQNMKLSIQNSIQING
jgi:CHAT domain-containing protein